MYVSVKWALPVVLALSAVAFADELRSELAKKHAAVGKKLERSGLWEERRAELLLALTLDPDCPEARAQLGYKKVDGEWKGAPPAPKRSRDKPSPSLAKEIAATHGQASWRLMEAALAARKEERLAEARALAGLALDEDPNDAKARALLDHEKSDQGDQREHRGAVFTSPRERAVRAVFTKALEGAKKDSPAAVAGDAALEKLLDLGPLERRESDYAIFLATKAAKADLAALARTIDVIRRAWAELVPERLPDAAPEPAPGSDAVAPVPTRAKTKARWILVAPSEHAKFVEKAIQDETRRPLAKQLKSWNGWTQAGEKGAEERLYLYECCLDAKNHAEWGALTAVKTLIQQTLPPKAPPPGFLVEGLARFFSGRATGKIEMSFLSSNVSLRVHQRDALGFDELRAGVRPALVLAPEGELRRLVSKSLNDLEDQDAALALAAVEFLLDRKSKELPKLLAALSPDEPALATLERVLGASAEQTERELRAWAREEY